METVTYGEHFARQGWYPGDRAGCQARIDDYLRSVGNTAAPTGATGGIVPHAGWMFSGELACQVFAALAPAAPGEVDTVILLGGHLGPRSAGWVISHGRWPTPVGDLAIDDALAKAFADASGLPSIAPGEYEPDNTIELQLPFVARLFPGSRIVAAGVPATPACEAVGRAAVRSARALGRTIRLVGSTDLTHYGPNYSFSPHGRGEEAVRWVKEVNDKRATDLMQSLSVQPLLEEALENRFCCCPGAAAAALAAGREAGASSAALLRTLTSYDVRPGSSFVGYAAVVF